MPFMATPERLGRIRGLLKGIEVSLRLKFGLAGNQLVPEIKQISDVAVLEKVLEGIETAGSPDELRHLWESASRHEEEKRKPFITTPERLGFISGFLEALELYLEAKLGAAGLQLMPEIRQIPNIEVLRAVLKALQSGAGPDELRRLWAPKAP
jgi:hypothetical protein